MANFNRYILKYVSLELRPLNLIRAMTKLADLFGEEVKDNKRLLAFFSLARPETQGEEGG